jgi:pyruvate dehydrogenase E1 component
VRAVADLIRPYLPEGRRYVALGTDGFGRSDTRAALRSFFEVDRYGVANSALAALGSTARTRTPTDSLAPWQR